MQQRSRSVKRTHADNRIYGILIAILVLLLMVSVFGMQKGFSSALALEQQVRCGMEEHLHTDECYINHVLVCGQKAHTHSEDCYLLLLEDNDINMLLSEMENSDERSLESLITGVVDEAIQLNQVVSSNPIPQTENQLTVSEISTLNSVIEENQLNPSVVLNENAGVAVIDTKAAGDGSTGIMPLLLDEPNRKSQNNAYFYMYIDDEWKYIGNLSFSTDSSYGQRYARTSSADVINLINQFADPDLASNSFRMAYESTYYGYTTSGYSDAGSNYTYFGSSYGSNNSAKAYKNIYIITTNGTTKANPLKFWSVTYDYAAAPDQVIYVKDGTRITLPEGHRWIDENDDSISGNVTVNKTRVFTEVTNVTLTLDYLDKANTEQTVDFGETITLSEDTVWVDESGNIVSGTITMDKSKTFYEACQVTLKYPDGRTETRYVKPGSAVTLDSDYKWTNTAGTVISGNITVSNHAEFMAAYPDRTITYIDMANSSNNSTATVPHGGSHTVKTGTWYLNQTEYHGGDVIPNITKNITLVANPQIHLSYNLNFPSSTTLNNMTYTRPTLAGMTVSTTADTYTPATCPAAIRNSSSREVLAAINGSGTGAERSVYFVGWIVNGDESRVLTPGTLCSWNELYSMLEPGEDTITLTGLWEYSAKQSVTFYIRYDSTTEDTEGNITGNDSSDYTNSVFCTHLFGLPEEAYNYSKKNLTLYYSIASATKLNSVAADEMIRSLYGSGVLFQEGTEREATLYLKDLPDDAEVLEKVRADAQAKRKTVYADDGTGQGSVEITDLSTLDTNHYKVRWYVFKNEDDSWHIDGKLVKKVGTIHVSKTFGGNESLISLIKQAAGTQKFYINAYNENRTRDEYLYLTDQDMVYNAETDTYVWTISNVDYGELWTITEYNTDTVLKDAVGMEEWVTVDTFNGTSDSGIGKSTTVIGVTHAADTNNDEWLRADFTNIYHQANTLLVRKVDGETGKPLAGATFQLEQNGQIMKFRYDSESKTYQWDPTEGTVTNLSTSENGYLEVIDNFTYEAGEVTVREINTPEGYSAAGEVMLNYVETDGGRRIEITNDVTIERGGESDADTEDNVYAKYEDGILTVKNYSDTLSVTAEKIWDCSESYFEGQGVKVQLYANNRLVSSVIPGTSDYEVLLDASNNYQYTWDNLPAYANGTVLEWSIKEVAIGSDTQGYEIPDAKGVFPNWIYTYADPVYGYDEDGRETVLLKVHNDVKRAMLRLTKYNGSKSAVLEGAEFDLVQVDADGNPVSGTEVKTAVTGSGGTLIFDNLKYAVRYRLTETAAPEGYFAFTQPAYLTINADGTLTVEEHSYVKAGGQAYNLTVINRSSQALPNTGGEGTLSYTLGGLLLMLSAVGLFIYKKILTKKLSRKE